MIKFNVDTQRVFLITAQSDIAITFFTEQINQTGFRYYYVVIPFSFRSEDELEINNFQTFTRPVCM